MKTGIIIPTVINRGRPSVYLKPLLKSLARSWRQWSQTQRRQPHGTIIIFANGVTPFSPLETTLRRRWQADAGSQLRVKVIANLGNRGFTGSINDSVVYAQQFVSPDWLVIINDDTRVKPTFFTAFMTSAKQSASQVVSCPVVNKTGQLESYGLRYGVTGLAFPYQPRDLSLTPNWTNQWLVCGTVLMVSGHVAKQMLTQFGYFFNPLFFAYAEDVELSLRWRLLKIPISFGSDPLVTHFGSQTAQRGSEFQLYHGYRNLLITALLTWSTTTWLRYWPVLGLGQVYALVLTWYKGYWRIGPKILKYLWVNRLSLRAVRKKYVAQLAGGYSF